MDKTMVNPLKDIVGFTALLISLPWLQWLLMGAPYASALGSYGAACVVAWRTVVLLRRAYARRQERRRREIEEAHKLWLARLSCPPFPLPPPSPDAPNPPSGEGTS